MERQSLGFDVFSFLVRTVVRCWRDLSILVEVDHEPTWNVVAADVLVPLWRVPNCLFRPDVVLLEEPSSRNRDMVLTSLQRVDVRPVVVFVEGDNRDLV